MLKRNISYIGVKSLINLKQFISSGKFTNEILESNFTCYLEYANNFHNYMSTDLTIHCKIKIISNAKTVSERIKHFLKVFNLVHKNDYTKISLEIIEEKERDVINKKKTVKHFMEANIIVDLL